MIIVVNGQVASPAAWRPEIGSRAGDMAEIYLFWRNFLHFQAKTCHKQRGTWLIRSKDVVPKSCEGVNIHYSASKNTVYYAAGETFG